MTNGNSAELARLLESARDYVCAFTDDRDDGHIAISLLTEIDLALSVCADGGKGEAVYQRKLADGTWVDTSLLGYEMWDEQRRRILYTAPQAECAPRADAEKDAALTIPREVLEDLLGDVVDYSNLQIFKDREIKWRDELIQKVSAILVANKEKP